jgi:hypothetical protein
LIRSLTRGTAIPEGVQFIHVGHGRWLDAQYEVLQEVDEDGYSETKFVRGMYGAGKSHFLSILQEHARRQGWLCAHLECKADSVEIDRFEMVYERLMSKLSWLQDDGLVGGTSETTDSVRLLLERWAHGVHRQAKLPEDSVRRPFDADQKIYGVLSQGVLRTNLPPDLVQALTAFARASWERDEEVMRAVTTWLHGSGSSVSIPGRYTRSPSGMGTNGRAAPPAPVELKPIGRGSAREVMRGLLWLVREAGFKGLLLCIDEIEALTRLNRKRQEHAVQALRDFVDNGGAFRHCCMYLAATPDMFEGADYFPRYDALATRIQPVGGKEINFRAPVIDLDRTPLQQEEMMQIAQRIWSVHQIAYGTLEIPGFDEALLRKIIAALMRSRFGRIARPRLLSRLMVWELERARQDPAVYRPPGNLDATILDVADKLDKERA